MGYFVHHNMGYLIYIYSPLSYLLRSLKFGYFMQLGMDVFFTLEINIIIITLPPDLERVYKRFHIHLSACLTDHMTDQHMKSLE